MRKRMSWDWVEGYPVFIYTTWIEHRVFKVDIIIGEKGNQNIGNTGPHDPIDYTYTQRGIAKKDYVVQKALRVAVHVIKIKEQM